MRKSCSLNRLFLPLAIVGLVLICCPKGYTQVNSHSIYWLKYQNQLIFNPQTWWTNELDNRRFINPDLQSQFIAHSRLHFKKRRWDYAAGVSFSWAYTTIPESPVRHATMELRPVMEVSYDLPIKNWVLSQRIRIDHRFIEENKFESVFDESNYIMRIRYRISSRFTLKKSEDGNPMIVGKLADEIMFNHEENIFDQNRISGTAEFVINKHWAFETGYIYIYQQRYAREEFLERHVLRFSLLHRLYLY
jgi:hypothetical protein